jgi:malate:Na+ symporter
LNIGFPILGGGMGGGAVPMAKVVNEVTGQDMKQILSVFVPAVVLGNVFSIIAAALLDRLGRKFPKLSGNGVLLKDEVVAHEEPKIEYSLWNILIGCTVACGFYAVGKIFNHFVPSVHNLVWMVLSVAVCNIAGIIPAYIISACYNWRGVHGSGADFSIHHTGVRFVMRVGGDRRGSRRRFGRTVGGISFC